MKLIVISSSTLMENEARLITRLFEMGLETFHLRKPKLSTKLTKELLNSIPKHFHNRIILHSHHNLARTYDVKGVHLTKLHKKKTWSTWYNLRIIKIKKPSIIITSSYNTIGNILEPANKYHFSYVFLSPIFDSLTSRFQGGFTEFSLKSALAKSKLKVIARGGVDSSCIERARDIGFDGIALYSHMWKAKDPVAEFNSVVEKFMELGIPIE